MMTGLPGGRVLSEMAAVKIPPLALSGALPRTVGLGADELLMNCTVPVGVPVPGELTVTTAVSVICCPTLDWLALDEIVVVVPAWLTVWTRAPAPESGEVLVL